MEQLNMFQDYTEYEEITIPLELKSPIESARSIRSKEFKKEKEMFSNYVRAIQEVQECSWFEARDLFFKHRDNQQPIKIRSEKTNGFR